MKNGSCKSSCEELGFYLDLGGVMYIEEVKEVTIGEEVEEEEEEEDERLSSGNAEALCSDTGGTLAVDVRRVLIGVGARALFYPTLLYNVVRNRIQTEFRWWDWIDEVYLLCSLWFHF